MQYFFVLGSNPALSIAEILSTIKSASFNNLRLIGPILLIEQPSELNLSELMDKLGGTIKVGQIIESVDDFNEQNLENSLVTIIKNKSNGKKINFGYSIYGSDDKQIIRTTKELKNLGMNLKRQLQKEGWSTRWVRPSLGSSLSSVVVEKNRLLEPDGCEIVLIIPPNKKQVLIGQTNSVQPFEKFSELDYGRPNRNTQRGMLPPKLARLMVNLSGAKPQDTLWDPFCGSGTILTEALQLNIGNVHGSDLDAAAIQATQDNLAWLEKKFILKDLSQVKLFVSDATVTPKEIPNHTVNIVVTEPFLGKPRNGQERRLELYRRLDELTELYSKTTSVWKEKLAPGAKIVLALPVYLDEQQQLLGINLEKIIKNGYKIDQLLPGDLLKKKQLGPNGGLIYGRSGQFVWREIVRLTSF